MAKPANKSTIAEMNIDDVKAEDLGLQKEQVGFHPYWSPEVGKKFMGTVISYDDKDEDFIRWTIQAACTHNCQTGKKDEAEAVTVKAGEFFNVSDYHGLPLGLYLGCEVLATVKAEKALKGNKTVWIWDLQVTEGVAKLAASRRDQALNGKAPTARQVTE